MTPKNINIYWEYWKFLKYLKKTNKMIEVSERMMTVIDDPCIPTDQWIEAHDLRFKSLLMKGSSKENIEEAINTLKKICYILPPFPVDGLWYIKDSQEEIEKDNEYDIQMTPPSIKNQVDEDVYQTPPHFDPPSQRKFASLQKSQTCTSGFFLSYKDGKSHLPLSKESMLNNIRKHLRGSSKDYSSGSKEDIIKGLKPKKKESYKKPEKDQASSESSNPDEYNNFLRITFKSDFLYQIGKVSAKSGWMLDKALKFLNDFLLVINYFKQDMKQESYRKMRVNAIYYIGIAYFQLGDKESAEKALREVQIELIETHGKDHKKVIKIDSILSSYFTERFNLAACITEYF